MRQLPIERLIEAQQDYWIEQVRALETEEGLPEGSLDRFIELVEQRVRRKMEEKSRAYQKVLQGRVCGYCGSAGIQEMTLWNRQSVAVCPMCLDFLALSRWARTYGAIHDLSADSVDKLGQVLIRLLKMLLAGPDDITPMLPDGDNVRSG